MKSVRRRYLAIQIVCQQRVLEKELMDAVWKAVLQLFGEYGASKTGLVLIKYDEERVFAVLRCSHGAVEMVRAAIASITKINQKPVALHVTKISGTIKALYKNRK